MLYVKAGVVLGGILAGGALLYGLPIGTYLAEVRGSGHLLANDNPWAAVIFVAICAGLISIGLPRLLLATLAGALFGFGWGLLYGQLGTLMGCYLAFLFVRWGARDFVLHHWPRLRTITAPVDRGGLMGVFLTRQVPIACGIMNTALALTSVRHLTFLGGTLLSMLPTGIPATLIGAGVAQAQAGHARWWLIGSALLFVLVWTCIIRRLRRSSGLARPPNPIPPAAEPAGHA